MATRTRRTEEQRIADLEAKIAAIKGRAERNKAKKDPSLRHISAAVRSIDKAMVESADANTRIALEEARSGLSACLLLAGVAVARGTRGRGRSRSIADSNVDENELLTYIRNNPGQRGEQISQALGTDSRSIRPVMKRLIEQEKVKTRGERRGMQYAAV